MVGHVVVQSLEKRRVRSSTIPSFCPFSQIFFSLRKKEIKIRTWRAARKKAISHIRNGMPHTPKINSIANLVPRSKFPYNIAVKMIVCKIYQCFCSFPFSAWIFQWCNKDGTC